MQYPFSKVPSRVQVQTATGSSVFLRHSIFLLQTERRAFIFFRSGIFRGTCIPRDGHSTRLLNRGVRGLKCRSEPTATEWRKNGRRCLVKSVLITTRRLCKGGLENLAPQRANENYGSFSQAIREIQIRIQIPTGYKECGCYCLIPT